jgi:hypothetical protein
MKFKFFSFFVLAFLFLFLIFPLTILAKPPLPESSTRGAVIQDRWERISEEFREKKEGFLRAKLKLGPRATEGAKKDAFVKAKEFVLKVLDKTIGRIQNLIERVKNSTVLTDERKQKLIAELQQRINLLKNEKAKVEAAKNGEELKAALKEVRTQFLSTKEEVKKIVAQIIASHIDRTLVKLEEIADRLENQIAILSLQGVNVTKFQSQLVDGRAKIAQAKQENAKGNWKEARRLAEQARAILVKLRGQIKAQQAKLKISTKSATPVPATQGGSI